MLQLPHINVLTKCDLLTDVKESALELYLNPNLQHFMHSLEEDTKAAPDHPWVIQLDFTRHSLTLVRVVGASECSYN